MAVVSKLLFERYLENVKCSEALHPWTESCLRANLYFVMVIFLGMVKHFGLAYLIGLLLKYKKLTKTELEKEFRCYLKTVLAGTLIGSHCLIYVCLLRTIFGKFSYYSVLSLPGFLASLYIFKGNKPKREIITQAFLQMSLQVLIKMMEHNGILKRNLVTDTFCFMITNAFLLYFLYEDKEASLAVAMATAQQAPPAPESSSLSSSSTYNGESNERVSSKHISILWPYQHSMSVEKIKTENPCFHFNNCIQYISNGAKTYFQIGCVFQLLTTILEYSRSKEKTSKSFLRHLLRWSNLRMGLFLSSYATIYRAVTCWLCQKTKKADKKYAFVGGFCSGISYTLYPQLTTILSVLSATITICLRRLERKHPILEEKLVEISFCCLAGFLIHYRIFYPQILPRSAMHFISTVTSGQADYLSQQFEKICKEKIC